MSLMNTPKNNFNAYLESYYIIHLITSLDDVVTNAYLLADKKMNLEIVGIVNQNGFRKIILSSSEKIELRKDYNVVINDLIYIPLFMGSITKTLEFDQDHYFNDWLGIKYNKSNVTFRLWAPLAKEVIFT